MGPILAIDMNFKQIDIIFFMCIPVSVGSPDSPMYYLEANSPEVKLKCVF